MVIVSVIVAQSKGVIAKGKIKEAPGAGISKIRQEIMPAIITYDLMD